MKCEKIPVELLKGKKLIRLKNALGVSLAEAAGLMAFLWLWAEENLQDGSFDGLTDDDIAGIAGWDGDAGLFCAALRSSGFCVDGADGLAWADWDFFVSEKREEQEKSARAREQARVRKQRQRAREKAAVQTSSFYAQNVTRDVTGDGNFAGDYRGIYNNIPCGGDYDDVSFSTREKEKKPLLKIVETVENCVSRLSPKLEDYDAGEEVRLQCEAIAGTLVRKYANRRPTEYDAQAVFNVCYGVIGKKVEETLVEQLAYAFEQSAAAGKGGDWRYINGIMERLKERGLDTVEDAMGYDRERRLRKLG